MGCGASTAAPQATPQPNTTPAKYATNDEAKPVGAYEAAAAPVKVNGKTDMKALFARFDADGDGKLDIYEIARAFRAIGLEKRDGDKADMDKAMFKVSEPPHRERPRSPRAL